MEIYSYDNCIENLVDIAVIYYCFQYIKFSDDKYLTPMEIEYYLGGDNKISEIKFRRFIISLLKIIYPKSYITTLNFNQFIEKFLNNYNMELEKDESSEEINFFKQNLYIKIVFLKNLCLKCLCKTNNTKFKDIVDPEGNIVFLNLIKDFILGEINDKVYVSSNSIRVYSIDLKNNTWKSEITSKADISNFLNKLNKKTADTEYLSYIKEKIIFLLTDILEMNNNSFFNSDFNCNLDSEIKSIMKKINSFEELLCSVESTRYKNEKERFLLSLKLHRNIRCRGLYDCGEKFITRRKNK